MHCNIGTLLAHTMTRNIKPHVKKKACIHFNETTCTKISLHKCSNKPSFKVLKG